MGAVGALLLALLNRRLSCSHAAAGDGHDREALVLRHLHPARLDGVQPDLPRRQRRSLGRAPAHQPARRQLGFLIVVNIIVFVLAFFLDFFELAFIIVPLLGAGRATSSASTSSGSACCSASTCRPPSCIRLLASRCSTCAGSRRARHYADRVTGQTIAPVTTGQIYWGAIPFVADPGPHGRRLSSPSRAWSCSSGTARPRSTHRLSQINVPHALRRQQQLVAPPRRASARRRRRASRRRRRLPHCRRRASGSISPRLRRTSAGRRLLSGGCCEYIVTVEAARRPGTTRPLPAEVLQRLVDLLEVGVRGRQLVVELEAFGAGRSMMSRGIGRSCAPPTRLRSAVGS